MRACQKKRIWMRIKSRYIGNIVPHLPIPRFAPWRSEGYAVIFKVSLTTDKLVRTPCPCTPDYPGESTLPPSHKTVRCSAHIFRNGPLSNPPARSTTRMGVGPSSSKRNVHSHWPTKLVL